MVVTITGANDHQRKIELKKLITDFEAEHGDMAIERYDGEDTSAERMRESIQSMPFLTSRKMVILREPGRQKSFADSISDVLKQTPETTDVVIYEPKLDKRGSYYKTLKKVTDFRDYGDLDAVSLTKWAVEYVKEKDGSITSADAKLLIERVGPNQQLVQSELDKLLSYSEQINRASIELLTEPLPQSTVFELLDAAFAGNPSRAFELYQEQRALKVEPQAIIAMLAWQLHVLAVVKAGSKRSVDEIAKEAKLNPFVIRKSQAITRKLSFEQIKSLIAALLVLDLDLKRSSIDADEGLQLYLLKMADAKK